MSYEVLLRDTDIQAFRSTFLSKREYRKRWSDMSFKERAFDKQATNALEENLRHQLMSKARVKLAKKGWIATTSYLRDDKGRSTSVYLSYGGKQLQVTAEGRKNDVGFFLTAQPTDEGVSLQIEPKREHYKARTRMTNMIWILIGLVLGIVLGLLLIYVFKIAEPKSNRRRIEEYLVPALEETFGRVQ